MYIEFSNYPEDKYKIKSIDMCLDNEGNPIDINIEASPKVLREIAERFCTSFYDLDPQCEPFKAAYYKSLDMFWLEGEGHIGIYPDTTILYNEEGNYPSEEELYNKVQDVIGTVEEMVGVAVAIPMLKHFYRLENELSYNSSIPAKKQVDELRKKPHLWTIKGVGERYTPSLKGI